MYLKAQCFDSGKSVNIATGKCYSATILVLVTRPLKKLGTVLILLCLTREVTAHWNLRMQNVSLY